MYTRFLRWASDRLSDKGIIAFVSNGRFVDGRIYDGFRKSLAEEFSEIYVIDLKGDAHTSGERRRKEGGNVFDDEIRVGIAIYFLIKKQQEGECRIYYNSIADYATATDKKNYLQNNRLADLEFVRMLPTHKHHWINNAENDWDDQLPIATKSLKSKSKAEVDKAIFEMFYIGMVTARDEWAVDFSASVLANKMRFFADFYNTFSQLEFRVQAELSNLGL